MLKSKSKSQKMREQASDVMDRLAPHVESARDKAAPVIAEAREKAAPVIAEAREKAAPVIAEARDKATPHIDSARTKFNAEVLPVITAAVAAASEATEDVRHEAAKRGKATAAALKGEVAVPEKKSHKLRNFFVFLGLSGVVAFVAKKLSEREASTAWQSSYTPTPTSPGASPAAPASAGPVPVPDETPVGTAAAAAAAQAHDEGAAAPDEAAADAAEVPHPATTPENPAEEIKVDGDKG